jgi:nucleoside-diphosphate-sugar epimerase
MKILVTGGLGFIGHNVVALLESQGHTCVITDTQTNYGIVPQLELDSLIAERRQKIKTDRIYRIDVVDKSGISWLVREHRPDTVIHLASFPRQKVVNNDPGWGSRVMSEGLLNLLEASVEHKVNRFVYVSSSMVYGNFDPDTANGIDETHPCRPLGQYGIMKLAGEWLVQDYQQRAGLDYTILRPSAVYGPLDVEDRVVSKFLTTAMRGGTIQVNGNRESLDFTHVSDAAAGIAAASTSNNTSNTIYNITRGHGVALLEAAELAVAIAGKGTIQINNADNNFPTRGQLNIDRACKEFGYAPNINIQQGFEQYHAWLKNSFYWT